MTFPSCPPAPLIRWRGFYSPVSLLFDLYVQDEFLLNKYTTRNGKSLLQV